MASDDLQLRDILPADPYLQRPDMPWWAWLLIAAGLALVAGLIALLARRKKHPSPPDLRAFYDKAFQEALTEIEAAASLHIREAATAVSSALRRYLSVACGDSSLYETHEEYLARHSALENYPLEIRERVSTAMCRLASLKYGRGEDGNPAELSDETRGLLQLLHPHQPA